MPKWLPITNLGFIHLKPLDAFMVRLIVPGTPRDSVVNSKLSPWNDPTGLGDLNWIGSCHKAPFLKTSSFALLSQNLISIFSPLFVTPVFS